MKVVPHVVIVMSVKFGDHRRWSESEVRGVHAPPLRAARPASFGGVVSPIRLHFRLRARRYLFWMNLMKFENLFGYLSVRNRTRFVLDFRVTVRWLPNLVKVLR